MVYCFALAMKKILTYLGLACMAIFLGGCATERHVTDAKHPDISIKADGGVTYRDRYVDPEDLPGLLRDSGFTREDTINIHYPDGHSDFRMPSRVMTILLRNGFPRAVLVGDRKSYSHVGREERKPTRRQMEPAQRPRVRYK